MSEPWNPSIQSILFVDFFFLFAKVEVDFHDGQFLNLKNKPFLAEGLGLNLHTEAKLLGLEKQTSVLILPHRSWKECLEFAFPSHESTLFIYVGYLDHE